MANKQEIQFKLKNGTSMHYLLYSCMQLHNMQFFYTKSQSYVVLYHNIAKGTIYCTDFFNCVTEGVGRVVVQHSF